MQPSLPSEEALALARRVRAACVQAGREAYQDAGIQGLCEEGRWEAALGAIGSLDMQGIAREYAAELDGQAGARG